MDTLPHNIAKQTVGHYTLKKSWQPQARMVNSWGQFPKTVRPLFGKNSDKKPAHTVLPSRPTKQVKILHSPLLCCSLSFSPSLHFSCVLSVPCAFSCSPSSSHTHAVEFKSFHDYHGSGFQPVFRVSCHFFFFLEHPLNTPS